MSQFPSVPPPGAYVPPNQQPQSQGFTQQQQPHYGSQQPQAPSPYASPAPGHPSASQKPKLFGQVSSQFNQAVTQGKPMLDKLGKSISSKLGNKHSKPVYNPHATPQGSYQNYQQNQQHSQPHVQQYQQAQPQSYPNQGQQFTPGAQSVYQTPQQSPFTQSAYGTPGSGNSGQNNYFSQQAPPTPHQQVPQHQQAPQQAPYQQSSSPSVNTNSGEQGHNHSQRPGQPGQVPFSQAQPHQVSQQTLYGQPPGQQTGVIGGAQSRLQNNFQQPPSSAHGPPPPEQQQQHQQWAPPSPSPHQHTSPVPQSPAQTPGEQQQQQPQWNYQTHAPQQPVSPAPQSPAHFNPTPPPQQYNAAPPVPMHPNQQQPQRSPHLQHQQWTSMPQVSPQAQQVEPSTSASHPPPQSSELQKSATPAAVPQQQHSQIGQQRQQPPQSPTSTSQSAPLKSNPTEFIAELPADLGSLSLAEGSKTDQVPSNQSQAASYRAYRPVSGHNASPGPGYTIARRAVSTSSLPLADPWRFADPITELPTREFYIIADLVFDSIDRRFEPQTTGLLEASKVLESWKAQQLPEEAAKLFAHDSYSAFGKIWSLEGVPHVLVPCQPSLMPTWNFQQQTHSQELKLQEESTLVTASYPVYMPALNRAGWYKYAFLNWLHQPEDLGKMLSAFCADTYNPGILNQPDIQKRDRNESPALVARATATSNTAVSRVCQEVVAQMQGTSRDGK
ncbi:uncharacterized protein N0V89_004795 [Didymosphaeria variabile]|uniref:Uncharacterized protein n=1 Tax=Didymosphaeria variabile TaxID=1932322 RepID=A0A9W8XQY3_9PLEO|nr:uncharacterized protein N0V89_004795 [Didymosphaeria variabile]KAJ4356759.1 hypothetical protein N0V89_004795 [Didymosphaeria variabile]